MANNNWGMTQEQIVSEAKERGIKGINRQAISHISEILGCGPRGIYDSGAWWEFSTGVMIQYDWLPKHKIWTPPSQSATEREKLKNDPDWNRRLRVLKSMAKEYKIKWDETPFEGFS